MLFKINYDVPANTAKQAPDHQKLSIAKGTIIEWIVSMPEESADLMQFRVEYHNTQIFPFSGSTWAYGLFDPIPIKENIEVFDAPYALDIYSFNLDTRYTHEYNIYCNIDPVKAYSPPSTGFDIKAKFSKLFGGF